MISFFRQIGKNPRAKTGHSQLGAVAPPRPAHGPGTTVLQTCAGSDSPCFIGLAEILKHRVFAQRLDVEPDQPLGIDCQPPVAGTMATTPF